MEYNDFKNVILILVKSAPKKTFSQKTVLPIGKLVKCQKNLFFWAKCFFGGGGVGWGICLREESMCIFYELKTIFYKKVLDFHRPSKILCQTSGRQNHWPLMYSL